MKFNKVIMGLGVMGLMFTSCDKAADQTYSPAAGVTAPPAYFSLDYNSDIVLEEGQTEFSVPIYRANTNGEQTVEVNVQTSANVTGHFNIPASVTFEDGKGEADIVITYDWDFMAANAGVDFAFNFSVPGEDTPYFTTKADYVAVYVPWENVVGPQGGTTSYFLDNLFWSGWNGPETQKFEVTVQHILGIPKYANIFRVLTPYANCPHIGGDGQGIYEGGDVVNIMYINAKDPDNVFLCNKVGDPITEYNTYYVMDNSYGQVHYWDRVSGYMLDEVFSFGGKSYKNSEGDTDLNGTYSAADNRIYFPEDHFFVYVPNTDFITTGNDLTILLPDGKEVKNWEELGMANYTDNFLSFLDTGETNVYEVPIEQSTKDPNIYRLVDPYTNNWIEEGYETDEPYNIEIDCTETNLVMMKYQDTGRTVWYRNKDLPCDMLNAGYFLTNQLLQEQELLTPDEVIAQGLNDTFEDGIIDIKHPMAFLWTDANKTNLYVISLYEEEDYPAEGCRIILPQAETGTTSYALKANAGKHKVVGRKSSANGKRFTRKYDSEIALPYAKVLR